MIRFEVEAKGFDKTGLNGIIDALRQVRDKMDDNPRHFARITRDASCISAVINLNGSADEFALHQQEYRGRGMDGGILIVGFIAIGIVVVFLYALLKIARDNDRAARHAEKELIPFSDVTVTHTGTGGA